MYPTPLLWITIKESKKGMTEVKKNFGLVTALQGYVSRMISIPGMKAFLMDEDTVSFHFIVYRLLSCGFSD